MANLAEGGSVTASTQRDVHRRRPGARHDGREGDARGPRVGPGVDYPAARAIGDTAAADDDCARPRPEYELEQSQPRELPRRRLPKAVHLRGDRDGGRHAPGGPLAQRERRLQLHVGGGRRRGGGGGSAREAARRAVGRCGRRLGSASPLVLCLWRPAEHACAVAQPAVPHGDPAQRPRRRRRRRRQKPVCAGGGGAAAGAPVALADDDAAHGLGAARHRRRRRAYDPIAAVGAELEAASRQAVGHRGFGRREHPARVPRGVQQPARPLGGPSGLPQAARLGPAGVPPHLLHVPLRADPDRILRHVDAAGDGPPLPPPPPPPPPPPHLLHHPLCRRRSSSSSSSTWRSTSCSSSTSPSTSSRRTPRTDARSLRRSGSPADICADGSGST